MDASQGKARRRLGRASRRAPIGWRPGSAPLLALGLALVLAAPAGGGTAAPAESPARPAGATAGTAAPGETHTDRGPAILPVPGAVRRGFEPPAHPYGPGHRGVALEARPEDPVRAALAGRVSFAGEVARVGWVSVDHGMGLVTSYGPIDPRRVAAGERVGRGQVLGRLAEDAAHLRWGARLHGDYIDPLLLLGSWRVRLVADP